MIFCVRYHCFVPIVVVSVLICGYVKIVPLGRFDWQAMVVIIRVLDDDDDNDNDDDNDSNNAHIQYSDSKKRIQPCTHSIFLFKITHPTMHTFNILIQKNASNHAHIQYYV